MPNTAHAAPLRAAQAAELFRLPASLRETDICPVTGQARMSYRRAAEIFTTATRPPDPGRRGWTLRQLATAQRP